MEIGFSRTNVRIFLEDFTCEFRCFMMYYLESKGKRTRRKRTDDLNSLATLLNIPNQRPAEKQYPMPTTMPTSEKVDMVSCNQAYVLEGASPPSFSSFLAFQTFLQAQQNRRNLRKCPQMSDSLEASSVQALDKVGRRRSQPHVQRKRQQGVLQEMRRLHLRSPTLIAASALIAPTTSSSSSSSTLSSTSSCSSSPPPDPAGAAPAGFEAPTLAPDAEIASTVASPEPVGAAGTSAGAKKKYPCGLCDKSFDYKHVLQNHNRTHTGEKPYQCPQCQKRFTRDHHLKTHIRLHTGEKPFGCAVCNKRFVQVANLRRHERVHSGERPLRCGHDDPEFPDQPKTKPFGCATCGAQFRRKRHRNDHKCFGGAVIDESSTSSTTSAAHSPTPGAPSGVSPGVEDASQEDQCQGLLGFPGGLAGQNGDGLLKMDVRLVDDDCYHSLGSHYSAWPRFHRQLQPCQEQPEDLSIKK